MVAGLLGILAEEDDPPRVDRAVHVVVPAVRVQSVLREGAGGNFQHHGGALAGSVVVLLNAINDALAGRVIHDPFPAHGVRDGAALSGMLALGLDGYRVLAETLSLPSANACWYSSPPSVDGV